MLGQRPELGELGRHGDWLQEGRLAGLEAVVAVVVAVGAVIVAPGPGGVGGAAGQVRSVAQRLLGGGGVT